MHTYIWYTFQLNIHSFGFLIKIQLYPIDKIPMRRYTFSMCINNTQYMLEK